MSLTETHFKPHFNNRGYCQCGCNDCHTRLEGLCLCLDCPCSDPGERHDFCDVCPRDCVSCSGRRSDCECYEHSVTDESIYPIAEFS